jgi:hypothetical protein
MKIEPIFKWYEILIGFFWDRSYKKLYFFPIPMFGLCIHFRSEAFEWGVQSYNSGNGSDVITNKFTDFSKTQQKDWLEGYNHQKDRIEILN